MFGWREVELAVAVAVGPSAARKCMLLLLLLGLLVDEDASGEKLSSDPFPGRANEPG
jgi:hypothetical protein